MTPQFSQKITPHINTLPSVLQYKVTVDWQNFIKNNDDDLHLILNNEKILSSLCQVWASSDFIAHHCIKHPQILIELISTGDLLNSYSEETYLLKLKTLIADIADINQLAILLRRFRIREMVRIIWRDISGWANLNDTVSDTSNLADACINIGLDFLYAQHCKRYGVPCDHLGQQQFLMVIALGKLGEKSLNISSDIDLMFAYSEKGEFNNHSKNITYEEFFIGLAQKLIFLLDTISDEGFVYRVDMRLRPYGNNGCLVNSISAMEVYYQQQGREWERYALLKARLVTPENNPGSERILNLLTSFVYRRYTDFGVIEALRQLKELINREIRTKHLQDNIKRGPGGIRAIEFIAQAFQLIRGGQDVNLRTQQLLQILPLLKEFNYLSATIVDELLASYVFLRNVEHRLQAYRDEQTQTLPNDAIGQARLAFTMGYPNWNSFYQVLNKHLDIVQQHFENMLALPQTKTSSTLHQEAFNKFASIWAEQISTTQASEYLQAFGFENPQEILRLLASLRNSSQNRLLSGKGRTRLNNIIPLILLAVSETNNKIETISRLMPLVEAIMRRSAYIALLLENPPALKLLVTLCSASAFIAEKITLYPLLLDELLDPRVIFEPLDIANLDNQLQQLLATIPNDDVEQQMDCLRRFKHAQILRVAATQVTQGTSAIIVSRHLSNIAEVLLNNVQAIAWQILASRHGTPQIITDNASDTGFAIIAYGKLGSNELGYNSDLDLVFLHDNTNDQGQTKGVKPISNSEFYARLAQRIINILETHTSAGQLYEIDTRLRPSGSSGLIVSSINSFANYQWDQAWTWEYQALVKARFICGSPPFRQRFNKIRQYALIIPGQDKELFNKISDMRKQIKESSTKLKKGVFHIKHSPGGMIDIEFFVQYMVLKWAHQYDQLTSVTENIKLLKLFKKLNLIDTDTGDFLIQTYEHYLHLKNEMELHNLNDHIANEELIGMSQKVLEIIDSYR